MLEMFSFREVAKPQQEIKMQEQKAEKYFEKCESEADGYRYNGTFENLAFAELDGRRCFGLS